MKKIYGFLLAAAVTACLAGGLTGCGSDKRREAQITYRQYGITCLKSGDYESAVSAFQKALDQSTWGITDTEIDICLYKAKAQYLNGDLDGAKETYKALMDYSDLPEAYYQRGCFYYAVGEEESGLKDFKKAVKIDPENVDLYIGIYENIKKYSSGEAPEEYLEKALEIEGEKSSDFINKGRVYLLMDDYDKAIEYLNKAIDKGDNEANFYLAIVYAAKGDDAQSEACFAEYTKSSSASAAELCSMADTLMKRDDYKTALKYLEAAEDLPDATDLRSIKKSIIICYERTGDYNNAALLMANYVKEYPDDEDAKRDYTFLKTR